MIDDITCVIVYFDEQLIQASIKANEQKKDTAQGVPQSY